MAVSLADSGRIARNADRVGRGAQRFCCSFTLAGVSFVRSLWLLPHSSSASLGADRSGATPQAADPCRRRRGQPRYSRMSLALTILLTVLVSAAVWFPILLAF